MKSALSRLLGMTLVVFATLTWVVDAEARRLGGGKTVGRQSTMTQKEATPPAAAPTAQQAAARPGAAAPAATGSRWMAPLAGLAAGLGLAALASWLGFGEELASFMLIALLVMAAFVAFRLLTARRQGAAAGPQPAFQGGYSNAGVGQEATVRYAPTQQDRQSGGMPAAVVGAPAAVAEPAAPAVPAGFDVEGFLRVAKVQFVRLQTAHDAGNLDDLREFTSPEMFAELKLDIDARGGATNRTDVVTLDAQLLGIETTPVDHLASVRFTGMIREEEGAEAKPFDEVWVLAKPQAGGGWVLAGIQQLG